MLHRLAACLLTIVLSGVTFLKAQTVLPVVNAPFSNVPICPFNQVPVDRALHDKPFTFGQMACWHALQLISPSAAARAAIGSAVAQWRIIPSSKARDADDYAHHFAVYYVRRSARETGELLAGYLNHEDPRPYASGQEHLGDRVRSALLHVLVASGDNGSRPALAPIAGAFASAFAGAGYYRYHSEARYAMRGVGIGYSSYFARALYQEFRPDMRLLVKRVLRRGPD